MPKFTREINRKYAPKSLIKAILKSLENDKVRWRFDDHSAYHDASGVEIKYYYDAVYMEVRVTYKNPDDGETVKVIFGQHRVGFSFWRFRMRYLCGEVFEQMDDTPRVVDQIVTRAEISL